MRLKQEIQVEDIVTGGHRRPHFLTAIPSLGMVPLEFLVGFGRLQNPVNAVAGSLFARGMEIGAARNFFCEEVLKMSPRPHYLFMYGDDMIPPWDGLVHLYNEMETGKWDVLTGLYYWKGEPPVPLTWRKGHVGPLMPGIDFELGEVIQVDVTGMDFTLIKVDSLAKLPRPYFKSGPGTFKLSTYDPYVQELVENYGNAIKEVPDEKVVQFTEDVWFCDLVREAGLRTGVHSGVRVAHIDKNGAIW